MQQVDVVGSATAGQHQAVVSLVSADYFSVMGIPLLQGRFVSRSEVLAGAHVAVVSSLFAKRFFAQRFTAWEAGDCSRPAANGGVDTGRVRKRINS